MKTERFVFSAESGDAVPHISRRATGPVPYCLCDPNLEACARSCEQRIVGIWQETRNLRHALIGNVVMCPQTSGQSLNSIAMLSGGCYSSEKAARVCAPQ